MRLKNFVGKVPLKSATRLQALEALEGINAKLQKVADDAAKVDMTSTSRAGDTIFSRRTKTGDDLHNILVGGKRKAEAEIAEGFKKLDDYKKSMSKEDAEDFDKAYLYGQENEVWVDELDSNDFEISDTARKAYEEFHNDSDRAYLTKNFHVRKKMADSGYKYDYDTDTIMKEEPSQFISSKSFTTWNIVDDLGNKYNFKNSSAEDIKKKIDSGEYRLMRLHPNEIKGGADHTHRLISAAQELQDLPEFVLPYRVGGNRIYVQGTHFVKVGRTFYQEGGTKFLGYAKTLIAGNDVRKLQKYADEVNESVKIYNNFKDDLEGMQKALDNANFEFFKVNTVEELKGVIRTADNPDGLLDADPNITNAKVYRNNEKFVYDLPGKNNDKMVLDLLDDYDEELSELMQISRQYYRRRGDEILANINDKSMDHVVVPFKVWQQNIMNVANEGNLGAVYREMGEDFKARFEAVIDPKSVDVNSMSGEDVISLGVIKAPNSHYNAMAREAARMQATYKAMKNTPTVLDDYINRNISNIIESLPRNWWDNEYVDALRNSNMVDWANAVIFRAYLGLFNIQQLFKNGILPIMNMATLEPLQAFKALQATPAVVLAHLNRGSKELFDRAVKASGMSETDFRAFLDYVEEYGTFKQMSQRPELSSKGYIINSRMPDTDLIFLKTANNSAQLVADLISFMKHGSKDLNKVAGYADDLMSNNSRVNTSIFQRSMVGKLVGTFTSYPISVIETIAGKHFTAEQKWRFALCQFAMWGFGGTLSRDNTTNMYNWLDETDIIEDPTLRSWLVDGVFTHIASLNGYDIREGADIGGMFNQLLATVPVIADMFGAAPDVPTGNVFSVIGDTYGLVKDLIAPDTGTRDLLAWARKTASRSHAPTTARNIADFIIAKDAKQYWDKNGDILLNSVDDAKAFSILMGFKPIEKRLKQMNYELQKIEKKAIEEEFNDSVKSVLDDLNTFSRTGEGLKEFSPDRQQARTDLKNRYRVAVKGFTSWVKEFHPNYKSYARSLLNSSIERGKDALEKTYIKDITERNKQFLGVQ